MARSSLNVSRIEFLFPEGKYKKYYLIPAYAEHRDMGFWEDKDVDFLMRLDTGNVITHSDGYYVTQGLRPWFRAHDREIIPGKCIVVVEKLEDLFYQMFIKGRGRRAPSFPNIL